LVTRSRAVEIGLGVDNLASEGLILSHPRPSRGADLPHTNLDMFANLSLNGVKFNAKTEDVSDSPPNSMDLKIQHLNSVDVSFFAVV
jgi:hypothetical protein